jgi:hypothetical protein
MEQLNHINPEGDRVQLERMYADRLQQINSLYSERGLEMRLIGSLGRAASLDETPENFISEYGGSRDIDVIVLGADKDIASQVKQEAQVIAYPLKFDQHFDNQIIYEGDTVKIQYREIERAVNPMIFAKKEGTVVGTKIATLNPMTHFHLMVLYGFMRPADWENMRKFRIKLRQMEPADKLPHELYESFHELNSERKQRYKKDELMGNLRWFYKTNVPTQARNTLSHITEPIWNLAVRKQILK